MNAIRLHLMLNHIPVLGAVFGLGLLLYALLRRSEELKRAALAVFVAIASFGIPAYLTGEPSEDRVEGLPGISKTLLEKHEEAAAVTFVLLLVLGVGGLTGLLCFRADKVIPVWLHSSLLAISVVVVVFGFWTANLGGQVRHTEIRSGATAPSDDAEHK